MTKLNILTRTSNRPKAFKRNADSIKKQTYSNINHIVGTDDVDSFDYISAEGFENIVYFDRENLIKQDKSINPNTGPFSPHNLYMNELHKSIKDGWVMYLDDDDYIIDEGGIQEIMDVINSHDEDTIVYWRMVYSNGKHLPINMENQPPRIGGIGSPCFAFHSKYLEYATWDSWKCSDFRVVFRLSQHIPKHVWLPHNYVMIPSVGFGNRKDC